MTLELTVEFAEKEDASAFQKFLRTNKCSSRLTVCPYGYAKLYYDGTIAAYRAVIPKIRDYLQMVLPNTEEVAEAIADYRAKIDYAADYIKELYATYKEGDQIQEEEKPTLELPEMDEKLQEFINQYDGTDPDVEIPDEPASAVIESFKKFQEQEETYWHHQNLILMLAKDGVLRIQDDGSYRMREKIPIDEVELMHTSEFFAPSANTSKWIS